MAKTPAKKTVALADIELHSDAWKRFETFVTKNVPNRPAVKANVKASRKKGRTVR